jgi:phenylpropionate dioxygenase-like ring-hydroxylating dioxygenase large terminal subunit
MIADEEPPLDGLWYFAAFTRELSTKPIRRMLFGEPYVLGASDNGVFFLLPDICPHRAAPLSKGRVEGATIACPYHGWTFDLADGRCVSAPALCADAGVDASRVRLKTPRIAVRHGVVWIYRGEGEPEAEPPSFAMPPDHARPKVSVLLHGEGPFDEAVIGLVDPAHTPIVHRQWWWRHGAARRDKSKRFEPSPPGFVMPAHAPSGNSRIYKLLGGAMTTEIEFRLPAIRIETIENARRRIVSLTAMTPCEAGKTHIAHMIWWTPGVLDLARPFAQGMAEDFLRQDRDILVAQNENLALAPHRPLFLGDPDEPAKWYMQLKRAWRARRENGGFLHPLKPAELRWRT